MPRFAHVMDLGFDVVSDKQDGSDITPTAFRKALMRRIAELDASGEWMEAINTPLDTIETDAPSDCGEEN